MTIFEINYQVGRAWKGHGSKEDLVTIVKRLQTAVELSYFPFIKFSKSTFQGSGKKEKEDKAENERYEKTISWNGQN